MKLNERTKLILLCLFFILIYTLAYPQHAFNGDENRYLRLGNQILEGRYEEGIFHREPMLPFFISVSYLAGLTVSQIRFLLPLIFGIFFLIVTYLLGKRFCKYPFIPVLVVLSLAYFWRWVPFTMVDILMGVFAGLSMLYFYRVMEDDEILPTGRINGRYLSYSMLFLSLAAITKVTSLLLFVAFFAYLVIRRRLNILKTREFGKGFLIFLVIFLSVASLIYLSSGKTGLEVKVHVGDFIRYQSFYFIRFAIVPWTLLFLYGIYRTVKSRGKGEVFILTIFLTIFIIFNFVSWKETRFLIFIFPLFAVLVENGIRKLGKNLKYIIVLFFAVSFIGAMLLLNTVSYVSWGSDLLTMELTSLESDSIIATDASVLFDRSLDSRIRWGLSENLSFQWLEENGIDYMVLSIYGEIIRDPDMSYYKPRLGFLDAPFLGEGSLKNIIIWWPGYKFSSSIYQWVDSNFPVYKRIQFNGQDVFIIYEVV